MKSIRSSGALVADPTTPSSAKVPRRRRRNTPTGTDGLMRKGLEREGETADGNTPVPSSYKLSHR